MSFNHYARKVRNPELSIWTRLSALRSCIRMLSVLTKESYHLAVTRFDNRFGFNRSKGDSLEPPLESDLLEALTAVEEERNLLLEKIRIDSQLQKSRKRQ